MPSAYVVLAPSTPPDSAKVVALFVIGATQNSADALSRAQSFKSSYSPTSPDPTACSVAEYNGPIVINP